MHHPLAIVGLILNTIAALMLLWFPPDTKGYQPDGSWHGGWKAPASEQGKRQYRLLRSGFQFAIALFVLGFLLQVLDLLRS